MTEICKKHEQHTTEICKNMTCFPKVAEDANLLLFFACHASASQDGS